MFRPEAPSEPRGTLNCLACILGSKESTVHFGAYQGVRIGGGYVLTLRTRMRYRASAQLWPHQLVCCFVSWGLQSEGR